MQPSCLTFVSVTIVVFLSCHFTTVYGKCSGRWAIHSCYGGNGKRSGPPITDSRLDSANTDKMSLLERILLSSYDIPDITASEMGPTQTELADDTEGVDAFYPDILDEDFDRQRQLAKTKALLTDLLLEKRFRRSPTHQSDDSRR